jgi:type II secretory pathway pseudopilin PulG
VVVVASTPSAAPRRLRPVSSSERGFTLAALIVIMTIMLIFVAYTVPRQWSTVMQREREQQTIWAMRQYARGIQNFFNQHKTYPVSMQQLLEARQPRVLRGPKDGIPDPFTGEMDWLLIPAAAQNQQQIRGLPQGGGPNPQQPPTTIPALPMKDWAGGPFIGVRPPKTGKSMLTLNGADSYEQWTFTAVDLNQEIQQRMAGAAIIYK